MIRINFKMIPIGVYSFTKRGLLCLRSGPSTSFRSQFTSSPSQVLPPSQLPALSVQPGPGQVLPFLYEPLLYEPSENGSVIIWVNVRAMPPSPTTSHFSVYLGHQDVLSAEDTCTLSPKGGPKYTHSSLARYTGWRPACGRISIYVPSKTT